MKINWGTGIVIALALFLSFILYFVVRISTEDQFSHDLVAENYYEQEMELQGDIDAQQNSNSLKHKLKTKKTKDGGLIISFPSALNQQKIKGKITFYRPANRRLDFAEEISLTNNKYEIDSDKITAGRWDIRIDWEYEDKKYLFKDKMIY